MRIRLFSQKIRKKRKKRQREEEHQGRHDDKGWGIDRRAGFWRRMPFSMSTRLRREKMYFELNDGTWKFSRKLLQGRCLFKPNVCAKQEDVEQERNLVLWRTLYRKSAKPSVCVCVAPCLAKKRLKACTPGKCRGWCVQPTKLRGTKTSPQRPRTSWSRTLNRSCVL